MVDPGLAATHQPAVAVACLADLPGCRTTALALQRVGAQPLRVLLVDAEVRLADEIWDVAPASAVLASCGAALAGVLAQLLDPAELAARLAAAIVHGEIVRGGVVTVVAPGTVVLAAPDASHPATLRMPTVLAERHPLAAPAMVTLGPGAVRLSAALATSYETRLSVPADLLRDVAYATSVTALGGGQIDCEQQQAPTLDDLPGPDVERRGGQWWAAGVRLAAVGRCTGGRRGETLAAGPYDSDAMAELDQLCSDLVEFGLRDVARLDLPPGPPPSWSPVLQAGARGMLTEVPDELRRWRAGDDSGAALEELCRWLRRPAARTWSVVPNAGVAVWRGRPDLQAHFPDPVLADSDSYLEWLRGQGTVEEPALGELSAAPVERQPRRPWARPARGVSPAVRVVGYLDDSLGLGAAARHLVVALRCAGAEVDTVTVRPGLEDEQTEAASVAPVVDVTVWAVNPPECRLATSSRPDLLGRSRLNAGYWWWEVPWLPPVLAQSLGPLDEIWVGSEYVLSCFDGWKAAEVVRAPLVLPRRVACSSLTRYDLGLPGHLPLYLARADLHSSLARKNPAGAIRAFLAAFPASGEAHLVVKLQNASADPAALGRLRSLAAGRADVTLLTEMLTDDDNNAVTAMSDVLVSLHRSEGLSLPIAEAMALGTAVLATDHGGSSELLGADGGWLVPGAMVPVHDPSGTYLGGTWAEPDQAEAVRGIRALAAPETRAALVTAANRRLAALDDPGELAAFLTGRLGARPAGRWRALGGRPVRRMAGGRGTR